MGRFKITEAPHKGLRNGLSQLSLLAGNTDYTDKEKVKELYSLGKDIFLLLNEHANDENTVVLAELEKKVPGSSKHDMNDHEEIEILQTKLEHDLDNVYNKTMAGEDTNVLGADFYFNLANFHSRYLLHMAEEETLTAKLLWDNFTDEEIMEMRNTIISRFKPELMVKWQRFILPALSRGQRAQIIGGVKATAPEHVYKLFMDICKLYLAADDYKDLVQKIG